MDTLTTAQLGSQLVTIQDETTSGTLTPRERFNLAWALNYQALYHYGRSPWVTGGYAPPAHVLLLQRGMKPPPGAWNIVLLDTSDQAGALGYHEDEQGTGIPFSEVFVKTAREDGADPAEVASHEMLEMLVDPNVNNVRTVIHKGQLYIVEVSDPVQGCGYDVGAPEGRTCGVTVADFANPAWFALAQPDHPERMSFRGSVAGAFELAPRGYISTAPVGEPGNWSQIFGSQQDRLPAWASRLPRIHGGTPEPTACVPLEGHPKHPSNRQLLELLNRKVDRMTDALAGIQADEAQIATDLPQVAQGISSLSAQLKAALEAATHAGTTVDPAELATIQTGLDSQAAALHALVPATGAPPAAGAPAGEPSAGVPAPGDAGAPAGGTAPPAPVPAAGAPAGGPSVPTAQATPLYTFDGDASTIDAAQWTKANVRATDGRALYTFAADTAGGAPTGDGLGGVWHAYTGPTEAVPGPVA